MDKSIKAPENAERDMDKEQRPKVGGADGAQRPFTEQAEPAGQKPEVDLSDPAVVQDFAQSARAGAFSLEVPILCRGGELQEIRFDFGKVTSREFLEAMDSDTKGNLLRITHTQAYELFLRAAAKANPGLDARDIRQRMTGLGDILNGVRAATVFFNITSRAASMRYNDASLTRR